MHAHRMVLLICVTALLAVGGWSAPAVSKPRAKAQPRAQAIPANAAGNWLGTLRVSPAVRLRIVFRIMKAKSGALTAKMASPDQGADDIPVDGVTFKNGMLRLEVKTLRGSYAGKLSKNGASLAGTWTQLGNSFPLDMERVARIEARNRPQEPKKPTPYDDEIVSYGNGAAGIGLAGTLTKPRGAGPFPAVLLITGSGPQNRDEEMLGHKPFLVIADALTRRGIAVLRVDDRGVGGSTGDFSKATTQDFAGDALAGVAFLKSRPDIDGAKIGLIGHSEGGLIAPMAAMRSPDVAFIVLLAGPGIVGEQILTLQSALIGKAMGATDAAVAQNRALQERAFALLKTETDAAALRKALRALFEEKPAAAAASVPDARLAAKPVPKSGAPNPAVEAQITMMTTPWFRYFLTYDPRPALTQVRCSVLAVIGDKDLQVPARENAPAIEAALRAGRNMDWAVEVLPGLNHLFQTAKTGSPTEYALIEETVAPAALQRIGDWIEERVR